MCQRLPWRQRRIVPSDRTLLEVLADVTDSLGLSLTASTGWTDVMDEWTGRYSVLEGNGPDIEILGNEDGPVARFTRATVRLVPEPDGRWLVEGANAWFTPNLQERTLTFNSIGFEQLVYART